MTASTYRSYATSDHDDLTMMLPLSSMGERSYRNCFFKPDPNARVGAGQVVGQAVWAAAQSAKGWSVSALQLCMLRAPRFDEWLEYAVESSGETPRTITRHVYGVEGLETVSSMHVRFAPRDAFLPSQSPSDALFSFDEMPLAKSLDDPEGQPKPTDIPFVELHTENRAGTDGARHRVWCRLKHRVPPGEVWCAAALAFMAASSVPAAVGTRYSGEGLWTWHFDSRDFSMFFHAGSFDVNDWLLFDTSTLQQAEKQYSFETKVYARSGLHLATSMHTCVERDDF